jgi:hypothetical protein
VVDGDAGPGKTEARAPGDAGNAGCDAIMLRQVEKRDRVIEIAGEDGGQSAVRFQVCVHDEDV